jgi:HEAT repeat protein
VSWIRTWKLRRTVERAIYGHDKQATAEVLQLLVSGTSEMRDSTRNILQSEGSRGISALSATVKLGRLASFKLLAEIVGQREAIKTWIAAHTGMYDSKNKSLMDCMETEPAYFLEGLEYCIQEVVPDDVKYRAIEIVSKLDTTRSLEALTRLAASGQRGAEHAIQALGAIGGPVATSTLIQLLSKDKAHSRSIIVALGKIGGAEVESVFTQLLKNKTAETKPRLEAAEALGQARCSAPLIEALSDEKPEVRKAAVNHLRHVQNPAICVPPLTAALQDTDSEVRYEAFLSLRRLKCDEILRGLLEHFDGSIRLLAASELKKLGDPIGQEFLDEFEARKAQERAAEASNRPPIDGICEAAQEGDFQRVRAWLANGNDVNEKSSTGGTLLTRTVMGPATSDPVPAFRSAMVLYLLDRGADPNLADGIGFRALSWAVFKGRLDLIRLLLDRRARIDARINNQTVLEWARDRGRDPQPDPRVQQIVRMLEEARR